MNSSKESAAPPHWVRLSAATIIALFFAAHTYKLWHPGQEIGSDFGQIWYAARALWEGRNPYAEVGPALAFPWPNGLYYPMTAAVVATPIAWLPLRLANAVVSGMAAGGLAWVLSRRALWPLLAFASVPLAIGLESVQWSPWFSLALLVPPLSWLYAAKPTIGAAYFLARPSWWGLAGGVGIVIVSLALWPQWPAEWLASVRGTTAIGGASAATPYIAPVALPGGALALLALLRWRRWEARLVAFLACVPQTLLPYEAVPLLLVPRSAREMGLLVALSFPAHWATRLAGSGLTDPNTDLHRWFRISGIAIVLAFYIPCTVMVLRRPNEGPAPRWLERLVLRAPEWLRGRPAVEPT